MKKYSLLLCAALLLHFSFWAQNTAGISFNTAEELASFFNPASGKKRLISAHRGGPFKGFPENAIETFQENQRNIPSLIIETDIALSKDSVLIMMHDNKLDRTTTGTGLVSDYNLKELKQLFLKDNEGAVTEFRIPTLAEVLQWGKGKVIFTLDVKRGVPFKKVVETVQKYQAASYAVIITYNATQAEEVYRLDSTLMLSVSLRGQQDLDRLTSLGIPERNMMAFVGTSAPDKGVYELLHSRNISCILGTMGNLDRQAQVRGAEVYTELFEQGADVLSTDLPELVQKAIAGKKDDRLRARLIDTVQKINYNTKNSAEAQKKPYVILISADGFRYDYTEKFGTPFLKKMTQQGVTATAMLPSFPTVTFPNHYTIATGLYPAHHGLVNNSIYNPDDGDAYSMGNRAKVMEGKWYGGTPLWVLAEQQNVLSANMFWVGSEAPVKGKQSTYWYEFNDRMDVAARIEAVKNWLALPEERRPHFITFYLSDVDHAGHRYGPDAVETAAAVKRVDSIMQELYAAVEKTKLPVNFMFVSDHGMTQVDQEHPIPVPSIIDKEKFVVPSAGTMTVIHAKDKNNIMPLYEALKKEAVNYKVFLKEEMPKEYHYSKENDRYNRIGDILLIPDWPYVFSNRKPGIGHHGYPASLKDMGATFIAWGPAFKKGMKMKAFENVHVYPLIAKILGLKITEPIDGNLKVLSGALK